MGLGDLEGQIFDLSHPTHEMRRCTSKFCDIWSRYWEELHLGEKLCYMMGLQKGGMMTNDENVNLKNAYGAQTYALKWHQILNPVQKVWIQFQSLYKADLLKISK